MTKNLPKYAFLSGLVALKNYIEDYSLNYDGWPIDDWVSISIDYDLNIWYDDSDDRCMATIYPVVNGDTITNAEYWTLFDFSYKSLS